MMRSAVQYRTMMRAMRDTGVAGHVLICDRMDDAELTALARQKSSSSHRQPDREDLASLMEHQQSDGSRKRPAADRLRSHE